MNLITLKFSLSLLLSLQLLYCLLGVGFNIASYLRTLFGNRQLTSNSPIVGSMILMIYGTFLVAGYKEYYLVYQMLMVLALFFFGYFGIVRHFTQYSRSPELYASKLSCWLAIAINIYGLLLNLLAAAGRFTVIVN